MAIKDKKAVAVSASVKEDEAAAAVEAPVVPDEKAPINPFLFRLVVRNPFKNYRKGHVIYSGQEIAAVIDSGNVANCNKIKI